MAILVEKFAKEVYKLDSLGEHDAAQFLIYDHLRSIIVKNDFMLMHRILKYVRPDRLSPSSIRAFLSITMAYERHCPARAWFYEKIASIPPTTEWMVRLKPTIKYEENVIVKLEVEELDEKRG